MAKHTVSERIKLLACRDELRCRILRDSPMGFIPDTVVVLGSGLNSFKEKMDVVYEIPYSEIPCFPTSSVKGHGNSLLFGYSNGIPIMAMNGRFHYYEGFSMQEITFPIKVFKMLGVKNLVLSAAVGSAIEDLKPGTIMVINDHLKLFSDNPLRGANDEELGPRFPDMTETYKVANIRNVLKEYFESELGIPYKEGVYAFTGGPTYETPAEVKALRTLGASVLGMSTVPEAIVANYCGINVYAFAVVTNMASGMSSGQLSHEEVIEMGKSVADNFAKVINKTLELITVPEVRATPIEFKGNIYEPRLVLKFGTDLAIDKSGVVVDFMCTANGVITFYCVDEYDRFQIVTSCNDLENWAKKVGLI